MEKKTYKFPRVLFAVIAVGGLVAAGIFLGILSVEGATSGRIVQAAGFGLLGLLMLWGAVLPEVQETSEVDGTSEVGYDIARADQASGRIEYGCGEPQ